MENADFLDGLVGVSGNMALKAKEIKVIYLEDFVMRNEVSSYSKTREYFVDGEKRIEVTVFYKKYFCQHPHRGKESWGMEITNEPIKTKDKKLKQLVKSLGYFIVCKDCLKECDLCSRYTSRISGEKVDGQWMCASCAKKHVLKKFWQDILAALRGGTS